MMRIDDDDDDKEVFYLKLDSLKIVLACLAVLLFH